MEGDADFDVPAEATPLTAGGRFTDTDLKVNARLPESLSASIYHEITPRWAVMGDVTWTNWDRLPELRIEFDNPAQPDGVVTLEWEDTFRYSIGVAHMPNKRWTYRAGVAYDEEPIPSADLRTPRIPGNDRLWVAVGMGYKHSDQLTFDFGYAHLFVKDPKIAKTTGAPADEDFFRGALNGKYDAEVDILSAQVAWNF